MHSDARNGPGNEEEAMTADEILDALEAALELTNPFARNEELRKIADAIGEGNWGNVASLVAEQCQKEESLEGTEALEGGLS
jgi:hypothetical protein